MQMYKKSVRKCAHFSVKSDSGMGYRGLPISLRIYFGGRGSVLKGEKVCFPKKEHQQQKTQQQQNKKEQEKDKKGKIIPSI